VNRIVELAVRTRKTPTWVRYLATSLFVLACAGLRVLLLGRDPGHSFFVFMPAVVVASTFLNRGNGIYASLLGAAVGLGFFVHPVGALAPVDRLDLFAMLAFLAVALGTAFVLEALHTARRGGYVLHQLPRPQHRHHDGRRNWHPGRGRRHAG
jgi:K+-sensing histidine kinase KdpD